MDDSIGPRILKIIEELCKRAKHDNEVAAHYAKEALVLNPNFRDGLENQLSAIVKAKEPDADAPSKGRL